MSFRQDGTGVFDILLSGEMKMLSLHDQHRSPLLGPRCILMTSRWQKYDAGLVELARCVNFQLSAMSG
jgi:hypothetical protein